jgi:hypothetical protein
MMAQGFTLLSRFAPHDGQAQHDFGNDSGPRLIDKGSRVRETAGLSGVRRAR